MVNDHLTICHRYGKHWRQIRAEPSLGVGSLAACGFADDRMVANLRNRKRSGMPASVIRSSPPPQRLLDGSRPPVTPIPPLPHWQQIERTDRPTDKTAAIRRAITRDTESGILVI